MRETDVLREGYRRLGTTFDDWRDRIADDPRAEWRDLLAVLEADFLELELPDESFEACASFYVLNHVPREQLPELLAKIHRWLVPGGWFMHAFGTSDNPGWTGTWLGDAPVFFASYEPPVNSRLVREAGFTIERDEVVTLREPNVDGDGRFQWILARR